MVRPEKRAQNDHRLPFYAGPLPTPASTIAEASGPSVAVVNRTEMLIPIGWGLSAIALQTS